MEAANPVIPLTPAGTTLLPPQPPTRISSLDQFRGYTVAGMFLVNYLAGFAVTPAVLGHHNTYCSYADTIMPQFFFAVGFAFRLTFGRRAATAGLVSAYFRVARRFLGLALVAIVFYSYLDGDGLWHKLTHDPAKSVRKDKSSKAPQEEVKEQSTFELFWEGVKSDRLWPTLHEATKRTWFQTLMHIAVTSIWILPVIRASAKIRVMYLLVSAGLHVFLSYHFNLTWINTSPTAIDGGPLGFLTWCIPTLVGSLACDAAMGASTPGAKFGKFIAWSVLLILLGYGLSCATRLYDVGRLGVATAGKGPNLVVPPLDNLGESSIATYFAEPPFVAPPDAKIRLGNYWMMSQRYCTVSYQVFSAGFSLLIYALFYLACDQWGWHIGAFRTLGRNALLGYIVGILIQRQIKQWIRKEFGPELTVWHVMGGFVLLFVLVWAILRVLEWRRIYVRM